MNQKDSTAQDISSSPRGVRVPLYVERQPAEWLKVNRAGRVFKFDEGSSDIWIYVGGVGPISLSALLAMSEPISGPRIT